MAVAVKDHQSFPAPRPTPPPVVEAEPLGPRVAVGGMEVVALSRNAWAEYIGRFARARRGSVGPALLLSSANGNVVSRYARDPDFRAFMDQCDAIDADGQPLVVASRLLTKTPIPERCATTDFFHDCADVAIRDGLSFYMLGGTEEANARAVAQARLKHPGLQIVGHRNGYFDRAEMDRVLDEIDALKPDILWIGLGVPREQEVALRARNRLKNVAIIKTCGGLFDFVAGDKSRAPDWMQRASLEWLYRLILEPRRLFWRYATTNVHAAWLLLRRTRDLSTRGGNRAAP
jgi:exopolysaccharide biosynthesis WecB/TagA/CpsF family protein